MKANDIQRFEKAIYKSSRHIWVVPDDRTAWDKLNSVLDDCGYPRAWRGWKASEVREFWAC